MLSIKMNQNNNKKQNKTQTHFCLAWTPIVIVHWVTKSQYTVWIYRTHIFYSTIPLHTSPAHARFVVVVFSFSFSSSLRVAKYPGGRKVFAMHVARIYNTHSLCTTKKAIKRMFIFTYMTFFFLSLHIEQHCMVVWTWMFVCVCVWGLVW